MSTGKAEAGRRPRKRATLLQMSIVGLILLVVAGSFGANVLGWTRSRGGVPQELGGLKLVNAVEGNEALAEINRLHGGDFSLKSGFVARYAQGPEKVTVWGGAASTSAEAADLIQRMVNSIAGGGSGFSPPVKLSIPDGYHNHDVYQTSGPGGDRQFFYVSKLNPDRVVWLAIESGDDGTILGAAVKTF